MPSQSPVVLDVAAFDKRAVELGLVRPDKELGAVVSHTKIAKYLGVAQSTVSRARSGASVGAGLIEVIVRKFDLEYHEIIRDRVSA